MAPLCVFQTHKITAKYTYWYLVVIHSWAIENAEAIASLGGSETGLAKVPVALGRAPPRLATGHGRQGSQYPIASAYARRCWQTYQ
jgi:hypothetical protein